MATRGTRVVVWDKILSRRGEPAVWKMFWGTGQFPKVLAFTKASLV